MGVGLFVGVWVARYLGPDQFGLLSFSMAIVGLFGAIATLGLRGIVVRDIVNDPESKGETLGTALALQVVGGVVAYALIIATVFVLRPDDVMSKVLVSVLGLMAILKVSEVSEYWFESQVQSKYAVWVKNSAFLVVAALKVALILLKAPLIAFALAAVGELFLAGTVLLVVMTLRGPKWRNLSFNAERGWKLLKDGWPLALSGIAIAIYMKIDQVMLGRMVNDEAVGVYSAAVKISEVWYFAPMAVVASLFPAILEAKKRSEELYYNRLQRLYAVMVWMAIGLALPMTFLASPLVTLLFGPDYQDAGAVLAIHIWASIFVFLGVASSKWFVAEGLQILQLQRTLAGAIVNVVLNLLVIPIYGPSGAAFATVFSYAIAAMFSDLVQEKTRGMFAMKLLAFNPFSVMRTF